jgi:transposase
VQFCTSIIRRYQDELPQLRRTSSVLARQKTKQEGELLIWKQKYQEERQKNDRLKKENEQLKTEIEKLTKTTNRYRASLFDHGNFHDPVSEGEKLKGGQLGHPNTNREQTNNPKNYPQKRLFLETCPDCGKQLPRVNSTKQKILLDIILNPDIIKLPLESERQWCGHCHKELGATDPQSLPFTEYGINTFMMALLLRHRCLLPLSKIAMVLQTAYGLPISNSGVNSLFRQAKKYLGTKYSELATSVRDGQIMYSDETGWHVRGKGAWMWIMANEQATVYVAAESRGGGIAKEMYGTSQAYSMHDGYSSYTAVIPKDKHLYCWAHMLRFAYEETVGKSKHTKSVKIRDELTHIYRLGKDLNYHDSPKKLEREIGGRMDILLSQKTKDQSSLNILDRLRKQRDGLIRSLLISPNGTNNFAEQELRPIALSRKISFGSDTYTGMETTAVLASVVQTIYRTKREAFFPELRQTLCAGVANS